MSQAKSADFCQVFTMTICHQALSAVQGPQVTFSPISPCPVSLCQPIIRPVKTQQKLYWALVPKLSGNASVSILLGHFNHSQAICFTKSHSCCCTSMMSEPYWLYFPNLSNVIRFISILASGWSRLLQRFSHCYIFYEARCTLLVGRPQLDMTVDNYHHSSADLDAFIADQWGTRQMPCSASSKDIRLPYRQYGIRTYPNTPACPLPCLGQWMSLLILVFGYSLQTVSSTIGSPGDIAAKTRSW